MTINSPLKTQREISIEKGKDIVIGLILFLVLLEGVGLFLKINAGELISIVDAVRITSKIILCFYFYKGNNWAKTLLAFFTGFGTIVYTAALCRAIAASITSLSYFVANLLMVATTAISVYYLIFSIDVDEFLKSQKV